MRFFLTRGGVLFAGLLASALFCSAVDPHGVAEVEQSIAEAEKKLAFLQKLGGSNTAAIEKLEAQIATLKGKQNMSARERLRRQLEQQFVEVYRSLYDPSQAVATAPEKVAAEDKLKKLRRAYLTLSMDILLSGAVADQAERFAKEDAEVLRVNQVWKKAAMDAAQMLESGTGDPATAASRKLSAAAGYRVARLRAEALYTARLTLKMGRRHEDAAAYMRHLVKSIAENDPNNFVVRTPGYDKSVHKWFRELQREVDLEEFRQVSAHAPIFDGDKLVTGKTRQEIAYFAELSLAAEVKRNAATMPISRLFWPTDSRIELAKELEAHAKQNPDHIMFGYLATGVEPSPKMYMLAIMQTLRHEQQQINTWLVDAYNTDWYNTGLGTLLRASDAAFTGDASFPEVKKRIAAYQKQVDEVFNMLERATKTPDPGKLTKDDRDRLLAFGYVTKKVDGSYQYSIPDKANIARLTSSAKRGLKLPGAPVLDIITPKNVAFTAVCSIVPGYAASAVEAGALRIGMSQGAVRFATLFTEFAAGVALDGVTQQIETGKTDVESILVESLFLGGLMEVFNKASILGADRMIQSQLFESLEQYKQGSRLRKLMTDPKTKEFSADWVGQVLGLTSEAAITTLYEGKFKGGELDFDTFMANVVNGAITMKISESFAAFQDRAVDNWDPEKYIDEATRVLQADADAAWLSRHIREDRGLAREVFLLSREQSRLQHGALLRYRKVVGTGEVSADRLFNGLLKGEISWMDLTIAYQKDTEKMADLMGEVKKLRDNFFNEIKHDAVRLAYKELKDRLHYEIEDIAEQYGNTDEGKAKLEEAMARFYHDGRYMFKKIIAPGSKSPVSDIDRSMQHPRLRELMVQMYEARAREHSDGTYIPTSARAFDVNEYYNVMPFIAMVNKMRAKVDSIIHDDRSNHGDMMEAKGHAAAMMHMNDLQQYRYAALERRRLEDKILAENAAQNARELKATVDSLEQQGVAPGSADARKAIKTLEQRQSERARAAAKEQFAKLDHMLNLAKADLARGRHEVRKKMEELGLDPADPESELRARDVLYQKRIEDYYKSLKELDHLKEGDPTRDKMIAKIELEMAFMLREGIETYSGSSTLDIVVNQMQIADLKVGPALLDESFTLAGTLKDLSPRDMDFMLRDQCLMMVEHINGYYTGHELPYNSGKALAKYGQRALLGMKIKGDVDLKKLVESNDMSNPALELHLITERLMEKKAEPDAFNKILSELTPHRNPDAGLVYLMEVIEKVVPGMKGMKELENFNHLSRIKPGPVEANPYGRRGYFQYHRFRSQRADLQFAEQLEELGGGMTLELYLQSRVQEARRNLADVRARYERYQGLGREFAPIDWPKVLQLERSIHGLNLVKNNSPGYPQPEWNQRVSLPLQKLQKELDDLRRQKQVGDPQDDPLYTRLWLQIQHLEITIKELEAELAYALELQKKEAVFAKMDLSGIWTFNNGSHKGKAKIQQVGNRVRMWFSSDMLTATPPHFYAEGTFERGRIRAVWEERNSPKLVFNARNEAPAKTWPNTGTLKAKVGLQREHITLADDCIELPRVESAGWKWSAMSLVPATGNVQAPTDLEILSVSEEESAKVRSGEGEVPDKVAAGKAGLYVTQSKADGHRGHTRYELYSPDSYGTARENLVAAGSTHTLLETLPGSYEMIFREGGTVRRQQVTLAPGQVTTASIDTLGRATFRVIDHTGREIRHHDYKLRIMNGGKPVAWCSSRSFTDLGAGNYVAILYLHGELVSKTKSYQKKFVIRSGGQTTITANLGGWKLSVKGMDGNLVTSATRGEARFIHPDGTRGGMVSFEANKLVYLLPGTYEMSAHMGVSRNSVWSKRVVIHPAELTEASAQVGSVIVELNGKPVPNEKEYLLMLTQKGVEGQFSTVRKFPVESIFPGSYSAQLFRPGEPMTAPIDLIVKAGKESRLNFKSK